MPSSLQFQSETTAAAVKQPVPAVRKVCLTRGLAVPDHVERYHTRSVGPSQCCSVVVRTIHAPPSAVWSIIRRFDNPQSYKHFIKSCSIILGDGCHVGSIREVHVITGLPAVSSTERLEILDEERHVIGFRVVGGDHRLKDYRSVTSLHESQEDGQGETVVLESYVVDVPAGNTREETCSFVDTIVTCNMESLARLSEYFAKNQLDISN